MKSYFNILFALVFLGSCKPHQSVYTNPIPVLSIDSTLIASSKINKLITPYKGELQKEMDVVIGYCPKFLEKKRPFSILGSFMAEAVYQSAKQEVERVDMCILNYGGIRSTLDSGEITIGEMYRLMPFENEICVLRLNKLQMDSLFKIVEAKGGEPLAEHSSEGMPSYELYDKEHRYYVATNDYMANGGDNYSILTRAEERIDLGIKIRDALILYVKNNNPLPINYQAY